ncbi:MAG: YraN family protein [Actinobacteria bacterium]|nr:YraN family protein [Actinomycetota bacterium]
MADKDILGRAGEERAARYLTERGYEILDRNWRTQGGELDLLARDGVRLVIVEVKTRRGEAFGHPFEAVDARKRQRLWRLGMAWRAAHPDAAGRGEIRIDVIAITGAEPATAPLEHLVDVS